jgi:hypothetical protein
LVQERKREKIKKKKTITTIDRKKFVFGCFFFSLFFSLSKKKEKIYLFGNAFSLLSIAPLFSESLLEKQRHCQSFFFAFLFKIIFSFFGTREKKRENPFFLKIKKH